MRTKGPLGPAIRRIVALALAPAGCGGAAIPPSDGGDSAHSADAADTADATTGSDSDALAASKGPGEDATTLDAARDSAPVDAEAPAMDAAVSLDAENSACACPDGTDAACLRGPCDRCVPACDPTAFSDGGIGPCASRWISGDGCKGGNVAFPCGLPPPVFVDGAYECATYCMGAPQVNLCSVMLDGGPLGGVDPSTLEAGAGPVVVNCGFLCFGRRPVRLAESSPEGERVEHLLAHAARLEAASVDAFLELARQLSAYGAPRTLVRRARLAALDEARHARITARLARARGATVELPRAAPGVLPPLLEIALHNAREGCVRETWGAACAVAQAARAADPDVRDAMRSIARDEIAHASLSRDVATWLASCLTPEARAQVSAEVRGAISTLEAEMSMRVPEASRVAMGLPSPDEGRAILAALRVEIWSDVA